MFDDRHALALGNGKVLLDDQIQPIETVNRQGFARVAASAGAGPHRRTRPIGARRWPIALPWCPRLRRAPTNTPASAAERLSAIGASNAEITANLESLGPVFADLRKPTRTPR